MIPLRDVERTPRRNYFFLIVQVGVNVVVARRNLLHTNGGEKLLNAGAIGTISDHAPVRIPDSNFYPILVDRYHRSGIDRDLCSN
jgi:hypothetical protein